VSFLDLFLQVFDGFLLGASGGEMFASRRAPTASDFVYGERSPSGYFTANFIGYRYHGFGKEPSSSPCAGAVSLIFGRETVTTLVARGII